MTIESMMLNLKRVGFPAAAVVLFVATADGFAALLQVKDWDPKGWSLAILLAAVLDAILVGSVLEWQKTPGLPVFIAMMLFIGASGVASTNFWYRNIRGSAKTSEIFDLQRNAALRELIVVRDRTEEAKRGLSDLSAYSKAMAAREVAKGDTCGRFPSVPGPRQRFRDADANFFAGLERDLAAIPPRISAEIEAVRALQPRPGETLAADLERLRLAIGNAESVLRDPALPRIADLLRKRIAEDTVDRREGRVTFNCGDITIRTQAGTALARIDKLPNTTIQGPAVPDLTSPSESLRILALIANWRTWGEKGGLSSADAAVVLLAILLELALFWSARGFAKGLRADRVLEELPRAIDIVPDTALRFIEALTGPPDPRVRWFCRVLARYQTTIGFHDRLVVAHGCRDQRTIDLAWAAPVLVAIGWARRDRWLPGFLVDTMGWWKWPETRGCERRETFRINRTAVDELHLGEVLARLRAQPQSSGPEPHAAWVPALQPAE